jgi:putative tricarboxylic transport membrane protein
METLQYFLYGFSVALQPINLFYCFLGVLAGSFVGVLPAIGPVAAVALLLPTTYHLNPISAIIMLVGVNYGAMYGGSTTAILLNVPGETASVVTCLDGHPMALQGRAGPALGIAAFGSFIAGSLGVVGLMFFAPVLGRAALRLGPPEYFALMIMSLTMVSYMARGSMIKALMMASWGLIFSTVGMDLISTKLRLTFNLLYLEDGMHIIPMTIGLFGLREVFDNFQTTFKGEILKVKIKNLLPTLQDWKDSIFPILRCGAFGFSMGILPGISPSVPTFISYGIEKKLSKHPEKFGTGVIEGVAGPEACNNAASIGMQVPLFSLGIPTNTMNTMLLAALMIWGMNPGPRFIQTSPDLFWGLIASMYIGNMLLLVINLPLIPLWVKVLKIPPVLLNVLILLFCIIGVYSINRDMPDVYVLMIFGAVGFLGKKLGYEGAPLILAFILGQRIEIALRQSLIMSDGSFSIFLTRPLSAVFIVITLAITISAIIGTVRAKIKVIESDEDF